MNSDGEDIFIAEVDGDMEPVLWLDEETPPDSISSMERDIPPEELLLAPRLMMKYRNQFYLIFGIFSM